MTQPALGSLGIQIERHWRTHRPRMVKELEATGQLQTAVHAAEQLTLSAEAEAIQQGMSPDQARERFREEWAFLPDEDESPELPNGDPAQWTAPTSPGTTTASRTPIGSATAETPRSSTRTSPPFASSKK